MEERIESHIRYSQRSEGNRRGKRQKQGRFKARATEQIPRTRETETQEIIQQWGHQHICESQDPRSEWDPQPRWECWVITAALEVLNPAFQTEVIGPEPGARAELGEMGGERGEAGYEADLGWRSFMPVTLHNLKTLGANLLLLRAVVLSTCCTLELPGEF